MNLPYDLIVVALERMHGGRRNIDPSATRLSAQLVDNFNRREDVLIRKSVGTSPVCRLFTALQIDTELFDPASGT
jgi:hypothetical protein